MRDDLVDLGDYPEIYADGLGEAQFLGANPLHLAQDGRRLPEEDRRDSREAGQWARSRYRDDSGRQGPAAASALFVGNLAVARQPNDPPA